METGGFIDGLPTDMLHFLPFATIFAG